MKKHVDVEFILKLIDEKIAYNDSFIHKDSEYMKGVKDGLNYVKDRILNQEDTE